MTSARNGQCAFMKSVPFNLCLISCRDDCGAFCLCKGCLSGSLQSLLLILVLSFKST